MTVYRSQGRSQGDEAIGTHRCVPIVFTNQLITNNNLNLMYEKTNSNLVLTVQSYDEKRTCGNLFNESGCFFSQAGYYLTELSHPLLRPRIKRKRN
jgi:hypothetical protein